MPSPPSPSYSTRRSSVFADLLTLFRRKSTFAFPRRSIYHAAPPSEQLRYASKDCELGGSTVIKGAVAEFSKLNIFCCFLHLFKLNLKTR